MFLKRFLKIVVATLAFLVLFPPFASAAYPSWDKVPADKRANVAYAFKYLQSEGYSDEAAAGIIANANYESGFDPFAKQNGYAQAMGFFQWDGGRRDNMLAHVRSKGLSFEDGADKATAMLQAQLEYFSQENSNFQGTFYFKTSGSAGLYQSLDPNCKSVSSLDELKSMSSAGGAACVFTWGWERPRFNAKNAKARIAFAEELLKALRSGELEGVSTSTPSPTPSAGSAEGTGALSDHELIGMPPSWVLPDGTVELPAGTSGLSASESTNIQGWLSASEMQSKINFDHLVRSVLMFVGILIIFYTIVLTLAFAFDVSVPMSNPRAVQAVTFGKYRFSEIAEETRPDSSGPRPLTTTRLVLLIGAIALLGGVVVTGALSGWVFQTIYRFTL